MRLFVVQTGSFTAPSHNSGRMWNVAEWVEESPRSGEEEDGGDSKRGLQWEGKGHVPICLRYGMAAAVEI